MTIHLPSLRPADELPENVRFAEFRDPRQRVAGFMVRLGKDRVLRLPTDTYYPCRPVDLVMEHLWYLVAYGLLAASLLFAAGVLLP